MVAATSDTANGARPHIDLDAVLGDRVAVRDVTLGGRVYQLRPLNLVATQMLEEGKVTEAFRYLVIGDEGEVEAFLDAMPAVDIVAALDAIYGKVSLGEASPPSPGSRRTKGGSAPSKRTSSRKGTR